MEARMESLDDEAREMKMSLVKRSRVAGLCRFCPPVLPHSPRPPAPLCLYYSEIYCSHFRAFLNPSWALSSREVIMRQSNFWIWERFGVLLWYKGSWIQLQDPSQKECYTTVNLENAKVDRVWVVMSGKNRKLGDYVSFGKCHCRSQFFLSAPPWPWAWDVGVDVGVA